MTVLYLEEELEDEMEVEEMIFKEMKVDVMKMEEKEDQNGEVGRGSRSEIYWAAARRSSHNAMRAW